MQSKFNSVSSNVASGQVLAANKMIRNTYGLLAMTILFSAFTALLGMYVIPVPPLLSTLGMFGMLMVTHMTARSAMGIVSIFGFTGFAGLSIGPMLATYVAAYTNGPELIAAALGSTGCIFLALSGYAMTTRKDFSYLGGFLLVALLVGCLASLAGLFFHAPAFQLAISSLMVLVFAGFILFDTSRIVNGGERNYILATVSLYLNMFNMFIHLLHIFGALAGRRD